jgi:hypothetical protein
MCATGSSPRTIAATDGFAESELVRVTAQREAEAPVSRSAHPYREVVRGSRQHLLIRFGAAPKRASLDCQRPNIFCWSRTTGPYPNDVLPGRFMLICYSAAGYGAALSRWTSSITTFSQCG